MQESPQIDEFSTMISNQMRSEVDQDIASNSEIASIAEQATKDLFALPDSTPLQERINLVASRFSGPLAAVLLMVLMSMILVLQVGCTKSRKSKKSDDVVVTMKDEEQQQKNDSLATGTVKNDEENSKKLTNPADYYDSYEVSEDGHIVYLDPVWGKSETRGDGLRGMPSFMNRKRLEILVHRWQEIFNQPTLEDVEKKWLDVTDPFQAKNRNPIVEFFLYSNRVKLKSPEGFPEEGILNQDGMTTLIVRELEGMNNGDKIKQNYLNQYLVLIRCSIDKQDDPFAITQSRFIAKDPNALEELMKYWRSVNYGATLVTHSDLEAEFYHSYEVAADGNVVYLDPVGGKDGIRGRGLRGTHSSVDHERFEKWVRDWQEIFDQPTMKDIIENWKEATSNSSAKTRDPIVEYFLYSNNSYMHSPDGFPIEGIRSKDKTMTLILRKLVGLKNGDKVPQYYLDKYLMIVRGNVHDPKNPFGVTQSRFIPKTPDKLGEIKEYWQNLDYGATVAEVANKNNDLTQDEIDAAREGGGINTASAYASLLVEGNEEKISKFIEHISNQELRDKLKESQRIRKLSKEHLENLKKGK